MPDRELMSWLRAAANKRVVCVGDVMLDRFVYGAVARISPEAPVPVLRRARETAMPGGAANVARNLASLGLRAVVIGVIGDDADGRELSTQLANIPRIETQLVVEPRRPTTLKMRFIAGGQQLLRVDAEDTAAISPEAEQHIAQRLAEQVDRHAAAAILLSDYAKGTLTPGIIAAVHAAAMKAGIPVIADPKGRDFSRYGPVDILKPNAAELAEALGLPTETDMEMTSALAAARDRLAAKSIVTTRAARGMSFITEGGSAVHVSGTARDVFDVSGAGDTALAALAAARIAGAPLADCVGLAIAASGLAVGKAGTATVSVDELSAALETAHHAEGTGYLSLSDARARVDLWRQSGLRVGFTNGCFDILHPGHIRTLEQARAACDRLVVAINSDASVRRLKGEGRPVNDAQARAIVLASLAVVDAVVVFDEDTPFGMIKALEPDVLVKGGDYTRDTIVGADLVEARGGQVVIAPLVPGHSTTATIARSKSGPA